LIIRGQRVMLDRDLADLYGVETKYLNRQVKRNKNRFPPEYMFQLTKDEKQEVVTFWHHLRDLRFSHQLPFAFTEHGVAMLSAILNSERAIKLSIYIINTFVKLRQILSNKTETDSKLLALEGVTKKHDAEIRLILKTLRQMLVIESRPKPKIGFNINR